MTPHTPAWKWVLAVLVTLISAAISIPLYQYADRDDAPGGMVIAMLIFVLGGAAAMWIVSPRRKSGANQ